MTRTVSGLIVPFNATARRWWGGIQFGAGRITIPDVSRVPLTFEHAMYGAQVAGVMTDVEERPDGVYATFALDDTEYGDRAYAEFSSGSRTGFSIGVEYDDDTVAAVEEAMGAAWYGEEDDDVVVTNAGGQIVETAHTYYPAFYDARGAVDPAEQTAGDNQEGTAA